MYNGNVLPTHIVHHYFSHLCLYAPIPQKEQVSTLESGFHAARQHDDDGRGGVGGYGEPFPEHEGGGEDEGEVEDLGGKLPGLHAGDCAEHICGGWVCLVGWLVVGCGLDGGLELMFLEGLAD